MPATPQDEGCHVSGHAAAQMQVQDSLGWSKVCHSFANSHSVPKFGDPLSILRVRNKRALKTVNKHTAFVNMMTTIVGTTIVGDVDGDGAGSDIESGRRAANNRGKEMAAMIWAGTMVRWQQLLYRCLILTTKRHLCR